MSYESDRLRNWYLLFHYGSREEILTDTEAGADLLPESFFQFPVATPGFRTDLRPAEGERALDIGCAVGRSSFELAKNFSEVIGIDFSQAFVDCGAALQRGETLSYDRYGDMHLPTRLNAVRPPDTPSESALTFEQGDAMNLREDLGAFDLVHAANLLCRLPEPQRFLDRLPSLVCTGGHFILATPATWMDEYTPREQQPTGPTLDMVKQSIGDAFELLAVEEVPFLIREHQRKLQLSSSQTSLWRKK